MFDFFKSAKHLNSVQKATDSASDVSRPKGEAHVAEWTGQTSPIPKGEKPVEFVNPNGLRETDESPEAQTPPFGELRG